MDVCQTQESRENVRGLRDISNCAHCWWNSKSPLLATLCLVRDRNFFSTAPYSSLISETVARPSVAARCWAGHITHIMTFPALRTVGDQIYGPSRNTIFTSSALLVLFCSLHFAFVAKYNLGRKQSDKFQFYFAFFCFRFSDLGKASAL